MSDDSIRLDLSAIEAKAQQQRTERAIARQETSDDSFEEFCTGATGVVNYFAADKDMRERFKTLEDRSKDVKEIAKEARKVISSQAEDSANSYQRKNPELPVRRLLTLLRSLHQEDSLEEILRKTQDLFSDVTLADEALSFLAENCEGELADHVREAQEEFNTRFGREIISGRNIASQAREFSQQEIGSPNALRDLYRDITENPREPSDLFDELSKNYEYSYDKLKIAIKFLLHSLGADFRAKGSSIPKGELARLFTETRSLQGILGIYRFFQSRSHLVEKQFSEEGLSKPATLSFETLAKVFMKLLNERYPSGLKIIQMAEQLGASEEVIAQIIIISQWRDAIRNIAPKFYKSLKLRDSLLSAILEALEELEARDEEDEEEES